jgi:hypothetical protein
VSGADLLSVCVYGLATVSLGACFLKAISAPASLRNGASAYLAGQLLWLLVFLIAVWVRLPGNALVFAVGVPVLALGGMGVRRDLRKPLLALLTLLLVCGLFFPQVLYSVLRVPLVEWDARSIWFYHGKAIWAHGGISPVYFADARHAWSHTDYPLLIPVQASVVGILRGAWSEMAVKGILVFNFMAYLALLRRILIKRGWDEVPAWAMSLLVMGIAVPHYVNGYADNHYAMPLVLAALLAFHPRNGEGSGTLALLLAGFAVNTKHEALPYVLLGAVLWGGLRYRGVRSGGVRQCMLKARVYSWSLLLLGIVPLLLWSLFKMRHGIRGDLQLAERVLDPVASIGLALHRAPTILNAMWSIEMKFHAPLLLGVVLAVTGWTYLIARRSRRARTAVLSAEECVLWTLMLMAHALIFTVYGLTPYDVRWHLGTSLDRVILFPLLMLMALLVCAVEKIVTKDHGNCALSADAGR